MPRVGIKLIGVSMMVVAACGGGSDDASSVPSVTPAVGDDAGSAADVAAYVDALASYWTAPPDHSAAEGRCIAAGIVEVVGVDALAAAGISPDDVRQQGLELVPPEVTLSSLPGQQPPSPRVTLTGEQMEGLKDSQASCTQGKKLEAVWLTELDAVDMSSQVAADDGQIYVGLSDGVLHALNSSDGTERWTFDATGGADPARFEEWGMDELTGFELYPTASDDSVYLGTNTGIVYALDRASGTPRWSYDATTVTGPPVVVGDLVVVGDWTAVPISNYVGSTIYIGQGPVRDDNPDRPIAPAVVNGLDAQTGTVRWSTPMPYLTALIAPADDIVVVASATGPSNVERESVVTRLDPATGTTVWSIEDGGTIRPTVEHADVYTLAGTTIIALAAEDGKQRWAVDVGGTQYSGGAGGWAEQIAATVDAVVAVTGGDPWWVVAVAPLTRTFR